MHPNKIITKTNQSRKIKILAGLSLTPLIITFIIIKQALSGSEPISISLWVITLIYSLIVIAFMGLNFEKIKNSKETTFSNAFFKGVEKAEKYYGLTVMAMLLVMGFKLTPESIFNTVFSTTMALLPFIQSSAIIGFLEQA